MISATCPAQLQSTGHGTFPGDGSAYVRTRQSIRRALSGPGLAHDPDGPPTLRRSLLTRPDLFTVDEHGAHMLV